MISSATTFTFPPCIPRFPRSSVSGIYFGARTTGKREKVVLRRLRRLLSALSPRTTIRHLGIFQNPPLARGQSVDCRVRVRVKVFYHPGLIGVRAEGMVIFLFVKVVKRPKYRNRTSVPNMKENSRQSKSILKARGAKTTKNLSTPIFFYGRSAIFLRIRSVLFSTKNSTNH
jgi:hypothetical protein